MSHSGRHFPDTVVPQLGLFGLKKESQVIDSAEPGLVHPLSAQAQGG